MTDEPRPVALKMGALRALLRQPDLPPDLAAKLLERTMQEERRMAGPGTLRRRLPIILAGLIILAVTAAIAFLLLPAPPSTEAPKASIAKPAATAPALPAQNVEPIVAESGNIAAPAQTAPAQSIVGKPERAPPPTMDRKTPSSQAGPAARTPARVDEVKALPTPAATRTPSEQSVVTPADRPVANKAPVAPASTAGQATQPAPGSGNAPASEPVTGPPPQP